LPIAWQTFSTPSVIFPRPTAEVIRGRNCAIIDRFCRGLSACARHQSYRQENEEFVVYCFAEERDAEFFHTHFGGERMTPET